jgi:ribosomal protein S18 acetylase RimI-like enzyme
MPSITYDCAPSPSVDDFIDLLNRSTLGERRPVSDRACMQGMVENASLLVGAYCDGKLVGIARSVTDFHYCCYLSDLAVDRAFQRNGIGRELIRQTQSQLGPRCKIILLAAPAAAEYYPHIGFEHHPQAWLLPQAEKAST